MKKTITYYKCKLFRYYYISTYLFIELDVNTQGFQANFSQTCGGSRKSKVSNFTS